MVAIRFIYFCGALLACVPTLAAGAAYLDSINFRKADSLAALYHGQPLKNLRTLSGSLTAPLVTDKEKFRAIYKWVCDNIDNDYELSVKNQQQRAQLKDSDALMVWNKKMNEQSFRNLIERKKAVCTGYAFLIRELALLAGMPCRIIDGYGRTVKANTGGSGVLNHSWNAVKLDGQWYLCDATWSSGAYDLEKGRFIRTFHEGYFLAEPSLFARNHYPQDTSWLLMRHKPDLHAFLNAPLVYAYTLDFGVEPVSPGTFQVYAKKGEEIAFQFIKLNNGGIVKVNFIIEGVEYGDKNKVDEQTSANGGSLYTIKRRFNHKGTYVTHVLLTDTSGGASPVLSYRVTVK